VQPVQLVQQVYLVIQERLDQLEKLGQRAILVQQVQLVQQVYLVILELLDQLEKLV